MKKLAINLLGILALIILVLVIPIANSEVTSPINYMTNEEIAIEIKICTQPITNTLIASLENKANASKDCWQTHFLLTVLYSKLKMTALANTEMKEFANLAPKDAKLYIWLVNSLVNLNNVDIAAEILNQASILFPENFLPENLQKIYPAKNQKSLKGISLALAKLDFHKGHYYKAIQLSRLANTGDNYYAYFDEGIALMNLGQFKQALKPLSLAYYHIKEVPSAQFYAKALLWIGNYKSALEPTLFALANDETIITKSYSDMLNLLFSKIPKSDTYNIILNFTNNNKIKNALFYSVLAKSLDKAGLQELAITEYNSLVKLEPQNFEAWYNLANDYEKYARNYDQAIKCYKKAYELNPYSKTYDNLVRLQERMNDKPTDISWYIKDFMINLFMHNNEDLNNQEITP